MVRYLIANEGSNLRTSQSETRLLFKEKFNVDKDEEFALHETPSQSDIQAYEEKGEEGTTDGPDPDNMKFDMEGGVTSLWNKKIFSYLVKELSERCQDALLPDVSLKYIEYLVTEKYTRCRGYWRQAQPRVVHGNMESPARVEARMTQKKEQHTEAARHRERRLKVSQILYQISDSGYWFTLLYIRNTRDGFKHSMSSSKRKQRKGKTILSCGNG